MILRIAAGFSLALGSTLLLAFFAWIGESPISGGAERHLREMKERTTAPTSVTPATFADFVALPHGLPVEQFAPLEQRGVSLEGYASVLHRSSDGDFHLTLSATPPTPGRRTRDVLTAEITPQWQKGSRWWRWEPLSTAFRTPWYEPEYPGERPRVRVSGWLLYDFQYDEPFLKDRRPRLPSPPPSRLTGWEIHPVTRIELWDDSLQAFVEYTR